MFFNIRILKMNVHEILFQPGIVLMSVFVWKGKIVFRPKNAPLRIFLRLYFFLQLPQVQGSYQSNIFVDIVSNNKMISALLFD